MYLLVFSYFFYLDNSKEYNFEQVFIKGLEVEGIIGIFQWEREVRQIISVDIEMDFDNKNAAKSDSIEDALNYKLVGKRITSFIKDSKSSIYKSSLF